MHRQLSGIWLAVAGVVFLSLGVSMLMEPIILLSVMAAGFVLLDRQYWNLFSGRS
jgi:hypothetical protein